MNQIWTKDFCSYCDKAKELMKHHGFEFEEMSVMDNIEEFREKFPDAKTVPQIIFQGEKIGGYNELVEDFHNKNIFVGSGTF